MFAVGWVVSGETFSSSDARRVVSEVDRMGISAVVLSVIDFVDGETLRGRGTLSEEGKVGGVSFEMSSFIFALIVGEEERKGGLLTFDDDISCEVMWGERTGGVTLRFVLRMLCVGATEVGDSVLRARCFVYQGDTRALEAMRRLETST